MKVFGITGWKNTGKTGLVERLVTDIVNRGITVSTLKHAHHSFDIDHPGKDSFRHRVAGASEVLLSSGKRWALMAELRGETEPELPELLSKLSPVDLVLIEGWKTEGHPKIECYRSETPQDLIAPGDPSIIAVASDAAVKVEVPQFDLNDTTCIANFILAHHRLLR